MGSTKLTELVERANRLSWISMVNPIKWLSF
jgi:hypothetical protein